MNTAVFPNELWGREIPIRDILTITRIYRSHLKGTTLASYPKSRSSSVISQSLHDNQEKYSSLKIDQCVT